eukprot:Selendium_serpulae@DN3003_c0_g2_i1.p1
MTSSTDSRSAPLRLAKRRLVSAAVVGLAVLCAASRAVAADEPWGGYAALYKEAKELQPWALSIRRLLHQHPELMYQEWNTSSTIQAHLKDMGVKFTTGWGVNKHKLKRNPYSLPPAEVLNDPMLAEGGTGVVGEIGTGREPVVLLRADIDALPIDEKAEVGFKSRTANKMHACGHDGHTTMLLMAAKLLKAREKDLHGTVRLMFQPAEEGGAGAEMMVAEGVLSTPTKVQRAFGFHVWPYLPTGAVATRKGPIMGAADAFTITLKGKGGHAAMPHQAIDPIPPAAAMVQGLTAIAGREL